MFKIPPNTLSFSGVMFGILSGYFFVTQHFFWAVFFFIMNALADGVDGVVARFRGIESSFGAYFDNFCGAYADAAVFCGLILGKLCSPFWGVFAIIGTIMRLLTFRLPAIVTPDEAEALYTRFPFSLGGKGDRVIIIAIGTILGMISEAIIVVAILTNGIAVIRTIYCYNLSKKTVS